MSERFLILCLLVALPFFGSCLTKSAWVKFNCSNPDFAYDIKSYSPEQLDSLLSQVNQLKDKEYNYCFDVAKARIFYAQKKLSKAALYFKKAAEKSPEFQDYFLLAQAQIQAQNQNFNESRALSQALLQSPAMSLSTSFRNSVYQILADIAYKQKDHQQIIKTHQKLLNSGFQENETLLFNLAVSLINLKEKEKADKVIKKLLIKFPDSDSAKKMLATRSLASFALSLKENEQRLANLIKRLAFHQLEQETSTKLQNSQTPKPLKNQLEHYAIKSLMLNNKFEQGINRAKKNAISKNASPKDLERYAWGLAKVDRFQEAADIYNKFMSLAKTREDKAKGCFFAGFSLYEASLYSLARFSWHACEKYVQTSSYEENFYWYLGFAALLDHDNFQAQTYLTKLSQKFAHSKHITKYLYFLSMTYKNMGDKNKSDFLLYQLAQDKKPGYYQLQARTNLGLAPISGKRINTKTYTRQALQIKNQQCQKALTLFKLGFTNEAADLILTAKISMTEKLALLQHIGQYNKAFERAYLVDPKISIVVNKLQAAPKIRSYFPLPHKQTVANLSKKYHIRKSLVYAIMREESAFFPDATSYRGAVGLMQMMPFVAHDLANKLNLNEFSREHLKTPEVAIEFGTLLLATLQKQFDKPYLAIAAYNAGPHQVQKWLNLFGDLPDDIFIERIPFRQTRSYVKKVLQGESYYRALQGHNLALWL